MSATWTTISRGYWNSAQVWSGGIVPPYTSSDTFIIQHPVAFSDNIVLNAGAFIRIDSTGGLCAHKNITVNAGANVTKYGMLEVDTLYIPGGDVSCNIPGKVVLWRYAIITNSGSFSSNCALNVGPWFECSRPFFEFMGIAENESEYTISIFPNPANDKLQIEMQSRFDIEIYDLKGGVINKFEACENKIAVDVSMLVRGIYFIKVTTVNGISLRKFLKD